MAKKTTVKKEVKKVEVMGAVKVAASKKKCRTCSYPQKEGE